MNKCKRPNIATKILWICLLYLHYNVVVLYAQNAQSDVPVNFNRNISVWEDIYHPSVFYFPLGEHLLIHNFQNNAIMLAALDELVKSKQTVEAIDTIEIIGACSPIGSKEFNLNLALNRCKALHSYLQQMHPQVLERLPIKLTIIGVDTLGYNILRELKPPLTTRQIWDRLQYAAIRLKMKDGSSIIPGSDKPKALFSDDTEVPEVIEPMYSMRDTVFLRDTVHITTTQYIRADEPVKMSKPLRVALKTNLLYDAALLPNLTAEWYAGKQWSLAVEGNWSWWTFGNSIQNQWVHRIQVAGIELRRWFSLPYPLHGHAVGVYSMIGDYDIRLFPKDENSIGHLSYRSWSTGLSYAYSFPLARRFNLELGLAAGYVGGRHYRYNYSMSHDHWAQLTTYNKNYIGPTRVGVSLVWLLGADNYTKDIKNK